MPKSRNTDNTDKAQLWIQAWEEHAPDALLLLRVRHSTADGEYMFAMENMKRRWLFDWCIPDDRVKVAVEVDGGTVLVKRSPRDGRYYAVGHHNTENNFEKDNAASWLGWTVLHFTPKMLKTEEQRKEAVAMVADIVWRKINGQ